jgi:hypothetical protein
MDFDFTTETITPDASLLLTIGGGGALELPSGTTLSGSLPTGVVAGAVRWNTSLTQVEYNNGTAWVNFGGNVTAVSVATANGLAGTSSGGNTPALTISTTVTGVLVGNGTAISAATGTTSFPGYAAGLAGSVVGSIPYQSAANTTSFTLAGTSGQALISGGAGSPTWVNGNITIGTTTVALGGTSTSLAGVTSLTMAGAINMNANQINNLAMAGSPAGTDAVNVNYLQSAVTGLSWKQAVKAATAVDLGPVLYNNGTAGVGATLTNAGTQAAFSVDTISFSVGQRVLVKNTVTGTATATPSGTGSTSMTLTAVTGTIQVGQQLTFTGVSSPVYITAYTGGVATLSSPQTWANNAAITASDAYSNGIYTVTTVGSGATNWVLTRALDADTAAELDGAAVYVQQGSLYGDTGWTETATLVTIGTDPIVWAQFSGSGSYNAGTGLTLTGNTFSLTNPVTLALGGTGANLTDVPGGIVYGGATTMAFSAAGTTNQILQSNGAGTPTWTGAPTVSGANITATTIPNSALVNSSVTVTAGTGMSGGGAVSLGGTITLTNAGVTSFATTLSGLTVTPASTGNVSLGGTLGATSGGTGQTVYAVGDTLYASSTTVLSKLNISATAGTFLRSTGTLPAWSTLVLPNAATTGDLLYASSANTIGNLIDAATGNVLLSGGAGVAPSYGKVGLTTHVTGILPIANGGTNSGTALSGSTIMVSNGTQIVQGTAGTTTTVLHGNAAGAPTYGAVALTTDVSGILPLANGGTNANLTAVAGGIVYSGASAMAITAAGTTGQYLQSNGAGTPTWVTVTNGGLKFYSEFTTAPVNAPSATASQSIALGTGSSASIYGVLANANGQFATAGDAEHLQAVLRAITTTAASGQELFLDGSGASQRLVLPANSAWTFTIKIVARETDTTGSYGSWIFNGLIYRDAGSPTISGLSKTTIARIGTISGPPNDPVVSADATNNSLKVTVTGYAASPVVIRWVATVDIAQVTN